MNKSNIKSFLISVNPQAVKNCQFLGRAVVTPSECLMGETPVVCAWCGAVIKQGYLRVVSHGICDCCKAEIL